LDVMVSQLKARLSTPAFDSLVQRATRLLVGNLGSSRATALLEACSYHPMFPLGRRASLTA
jgi:hypothetical protein